MKNDDWRSVEIVSLCHLITSEKLSAQGGASWNQDPGSGIMPPI
jgi:hypothetical protein